MKHDTSYKHRLIIRADADKSMGAGHIMRCIALGQAWQKKEGEVLFVSHLENKSIEQLIIKNKFELINIKKAYPHPDDIHHLRSILSEEKSGKKFWVAVDGYHFNSDFHREIKRTECNLLILDDTAHLETYTADILLNPNPSAQELKYNINRRINFLFGEKYFLLREEFLKWENHQKKYPDTAHRILISPGGSDPGNMTAKVIRAIRALDQKNLFLTVVAGPLNPNMTELRKLLVDSAIPHELMAHSADMPAVMHKADLAVCAAGGTCFELAFMGVPSLAMTLAENQKDNAAAVSSAGSAINLGTSENTTEETLTATICKLIKDKDTRKRMGESGRCFIDGHGADRVVMEMLPAQFFLRKAELKDCRKVFEWANDSLTRRFSFHSDPIPWDHHQEWFADTLKNPNCRYFIAATESGKLVGQARFRENGKSATISVSVDAAYRNAGLGNRIIREACLKFLSEEKSKPIQAYIKPENHASLKAFKKAGFVRTETTHFNNIPAVKMVFEGK